MRTTRLLVAAGLLAATASVPAVAATTEGPSPRTTVVAPAPYGVVELGRSVHFRAHGGCAGEKALVIAEFGTNHSVAGPASRGCTGTAAVPTEEALTKAGWTPGQPLDLALTVGSATVPLRHRHIDTGTASVAAGSPQSLPASGDEESPDGAAMLMQAGDVIALGRVNLTGVYGVAVRAEGAFTYEFRAGSADGKVVAAGSGGRQRSDWMLRQPGHNKDDYLLTTSELKHAPMGAATPLFLAVTSGVGSVNFVELTGSGVMTPYKFPDRLPHAISMFNGHDLSGWKQMGPGGFTVDHGTMRSDPPPPGNWGWHYYTKRTFKNFVMRLQFKTTEWGDNSGVLVRHAATGEQNQSAFTAEEIQITDVNTEYTGGIDHVQAAYTQAQSSPGDWSTMEIVTNGPHFLVRVNGVLTAVYDDSTGCGLAALPCAGGETGGYVTGGNGYLAVEAEVGHVFFRNLQVHPCAKDDDPLCTVAG